MIEQIALSWFKEKTDNVPRCMTVTWSQLCDRFKKPPRRTPCTVDNCLSAGWRKAVAAVAAAATTTAAKTDDCPHKDGMNWSPATYPAGARRLKKNVDAIGLLVVDGDHWPEEILVETRARVSKYQYLIHASHSDRPANPNAQCTCGSEPGALHGTTCPARVDRCVRIILMLSRPVKGAEWPRFWRAAMKRLGFAADPSTCDANRVYFFPSRPSDADYFCDVNDGEALDVDEILASAPIEEAQAPSIAADLQLGDEGVVLPGQRHALLKSIAGAVRFRGAGEEEILAALHEANKRRCQPPKPDEELQNLARWAAEQPITTLARYAEDSGEENSGEENSGEEDSGEENSGEAAGDAQAGDTPSDAGTAMPQPQILETQVAKKVRKKFERNEEGRIKQTQKNVLLATRAFGVTFTFDQFALHERIHGLKGFGPRLDDAALNRLWLAIDGELGFRVGRQFFITFLGDQAQLHRFHPVREYLDSQKWDRTPRIGDAEQPGWLTTYGGAPDTPYVRAVSRLILVAAARRVRQPGAKFDEMPILEGEQGCEKSSALRVMAVRDEWFSDDLPLGADTKKLIEATAGKLIVEAGELKGVNKADVAALKSYLSRQMDESRMSYDKKNTVRLRQFVIIGTTNEYDGYLKDTTGNRRFWPVRVQHFDLKRLRADRDQLWAEASEAEAAGESIRLDPKLYGDAAIEQDARRSHDPIAEVLRVHLGRKTGKLRALDVWAMVGIEPGKSQQDQIARVGTAMRELGWEYVKQLRFEGDRYAAYVRGTEKEREVRVWVEVDSISKTVRISHEEPKPESAEQGTLKDRVIAAARSRPEGFLTATELECAVKGSRKGVSALIKELIKTGELAVRGNAIHVRDPKQSPQEGQAAQDSHPPSTNGVGGPRERS